MACGSGHCRLHRACSRGGVLDDSGMAEWWQVGPQDNSFQGIYGILESKPLQSCREPELWHEDINMCKRTAAPILFPCIVPGSAELIDSCEVMMGYADNNHKTAGIHMRHLARLRSSTHPPAGWLSVKVTVITVAVETAIISIIFHHFPSLDMRVS